MDKGVKVEHWAGLFPPYKPPVLLQPSYLTGGATDGKETPGEAQAEPRAPSGRSVRLDIRRKTVSGGALWRRRIPSNLRRISRGDGRRPFTIPRAAAPLVRVAAVVGVSSDFRRWDQRLSQPTPPLVPATVTAVDLAPTLPVKLTPPKE